MSTLHLVTFVVVLLLVPIHAVDQIALFSGSFSPNVDVFDGAKWTVSYMPSPASLMGVASVAGKAFWLGGSSTQYPGGVPKVNVYDSSNGSWSLSPFYPEPRSWIGATSVGNKAFFAGGESGFGWSPTVEIYDADKDSWSATRLSAYRGAICAVSVGTFAIFAGGQCGLDPIGDCPNVEVYDSVKGTWAWSVLNYPKTYTGCVSNGTHAFFVESSGGVDVYDPTTATWTWRQFGVPSGSDASVVATPKFFLVAGGFVNEARDCSNTIIAHSFFDGTQLFNASLSSARGAMGATVIGNKAIFAGGQSAWATFADADVLDLETGKVETVKLSAARGYLQGITVDVKKADV